MILVKCPTIFSAVSRPFKCDFHIEIFTLYFTKLQYALVTSGFFYIEEAKDISNILFGRVCSLLMLSLDLVLQVSWRVRLLSGGRNPRLHWSTFITVHLTATYF